MRPFNASNSSPQTSLCIMGRVFKRRRQDALTPLQMLQLLSEQRLVAVLQGSCIWLAVDSATAQLLDRCCTGQQDGGPATALEVMSFMSLWRLQGQQDQAQGEQEPSAQQIQHKPLEMQVDAAEQQGDTTEQGKREGRPPIAIRLSLEESFFLKYTFNSLTVIQASSGTGPPVELSEQGLWDACRAIRSNFPESYAGYHHLKSKGWLPRSGLLYGVDYVVYQMHPLAAHSEFGVMLVPLKGPYRPELKWLDVQITNRLINQVSKRLLLLYLYESPDSPGPETAACLEHYTAEERLLRRWAYSSTR